jgi:hypothetical protein
MKVNLFNYVEPLPVPTVNCEPIYQYVPEVDIFKGFTEEQMKSIRQETIDYLNQLMALGDQ